VSTGRLLSALGRALGRAGRIAAASGRDLAEAFAAAGRSWLGLDARLRRGLIGGGAALALVVLLVAVAVPALPCQFPAGDVCAPPDDAAELVPADALAYLHIDVDRSSAQYRLAADEVRRIPTISSQLVGRLLADLPGVAGSTSRFDRSIAPWLGSEAALALIPSGRVSQEVELLRVATAGGAERYQLGFEGPGARTVTYRGTRIMVGRGGIASSIVHGFLAIGTRAAVRAVVETATGAADAWPLSGSSAASAVRGMLPSQRVADAYLAPGGVAAIIGRSRAPLASLAPFVSPGASGGVAAALVAADGSVELEVRSALDPKPATSRPGSLAAFPRFQPTLADHLPARTLVYLGAGEPGQTIAPLLGRAATQGRTLARAASAFAHRLDAGGKVSVGRDLAPVLGSEGALAVEPAPAGPPYLLYLGGTVDPGAARTSLARLRAPLARALAPGAGGFRRIRVGRVAAYALPGTPFGTLTYAIVGGRFVVATNRAGIIAAASGGGGLASSDAYRAATAGLPSSTSVIAYVDLGAFVSLAERAGLAANPGYASYAPDIHRLSAVAAAVASSPTLLSTDARLAFRAGGAK
jgi:hypothetical protein